MKYLKTKLTQIKQLILSFVSGWQTKEPQIN